MKCLQCGDQFVKRLPRERAAMDTRILAASIGPMPRPISDPIGVFDPMPTVTVIFENGQLKELFSFYPDELTFTESEFIRLTEKEAHALFFQKDIEYLRS